MADLDDIVKVLEQIRDETVPGLSSSISELSSATAEAAAASREAADAAEDMAEASEELSENLEEAGDSAKEASKGLGDFTTGLGLMGKGMKKTASGIGGITRGFGQLASSAAGTVLAIKAKSDAIVGNIQTMRRSTGISKEMAFQIADTADALRIYGVTSADAAAAVDTLYTSTSVYSQLSSEMQDTLATEGALLAQLGVSMSDYAQGIEVGMKSMGMTADEASDNMFKLRATAIDLNIPISQLTSNFAANADMLAKLGDNGVEAFSELTRISKITGMEMNKLLAVTDKFDTFEGAAEAAGSLNAALGGNFVDSMSLMMETDPAERFKMIRGAVEDAGVAFEDMGYYQKKMMADAAGFSDVGDFAKAMSGDLNALAGDMGKTDATVEAAMEEAAIVRTPEEMAANFAKALEPAAGAIAKTMVDASDEFGKKMLPTIQQLDASTKAMTDSVIEDFGFVGELLVLIGYLQVIGPLVVGIVSKFGGFLTIGKGIATTLGGALTTVGGALTSLPVIIGTVVFAFTSAFVGIAKKWNEITDLFSAGKWGEAISLTAGAALTGVIAGFGKVAAYIAEALGFNSPWITTFKDAFGPKTFDKIMLGIATSLVDGFDSIVKSITEVVTELDAILFTAFTDAAESGYQGFLDFFQISSPSRLMMDMIGGPLLDGIMAPFKNIGKLVVDMVGRPMLDGLMASFKDIGSLIMNDVAPIIKSALFTPFIDFPSLLKDIMLGAVEIIPDPIMKLISGETGVAETAVDLAEVATDKVAGAFDAMGDFVSGDETKEPYVLNISLNMDGREIDKKVINIVGGIARDATVGG